MTNEKNNLYDELKYNSIQHLIKSVGKWKTDSYIEMPSEWSSNERYLPAGTTEYPGLVDYDIAPHMIEIVDNFNHEVNSIISNNNN